MRYLFISIILSSIFFNMVLAQSNFKINYSWPDKNHIFLTWNTVDNAAGYEIELAKIDGSLDRISTKLNNYTFPVSKDKILFITLKARSPEEQIIGQNTIKLTAEPTGGGGVESGGGAGSFEEGSKVTLRRWFLGTPQDFMQLIIRLLLIFVSVVAVIGIIIGGYQYITSAGNPETAEKGKATLTWSVVGLILAWASALIIFYIANSLGT